MSTNTPVVSVQSHTAAAAAKPDTAAAANVQGPPPAVGRVLNLMTATITSRVLGELSQAGVISAMAKHSQPVSAAQLATETKLNADALQRSLRLCAAEDWFTESADGKFALKDAVVLVPSTPGAVNSTLEIWSVCPSHQGPLSHFSHSLRTGDVAIKQGLQKDTVWDWFAEHQKEKMRFSEAMTSLSLPTAGVVAASIDFKPYKLYCDVGGSAGTMAFGVKQAQPHLTALSFDLASLTDDVKKNPLPGVEYVAGDFFQSVPEAEVYSMKHILHDWRDDQCITILRNIHKAMRGNGVLLLVESILPDMGDNSNALAKAVDIVMLNIASGRERTRADWDKLLKDGGFRVENVVDTPLPLKVIVCKKL